MPTGLKPWGKIDTVLKTKTPKTFKNLRRFIWAANYHRDMWPQRSHVLASLISQVGARVRIRESTKFKWMPENQTAFDKMKSIMTMDALSAHPNHNKSFHVYTDTSYYHLGACIILEGRLVAYYSRKLNIAQRIYIVQENELLSVVVTLRELRSMLLGAELYVNMDHVNNTFEALRTKRNLLVNMIIICNFYLVFFRARMCALQGGDLD
ncbi:hypothetical protein ACHAWF_001744 [Thalassiosira exigua]